MGHLVRGILRTPTDARSANRQRRKQIALLKAGSIRHVMACSIFACNVDDIRALVNSEDPACTEFGGENRQDTGPVE
jgi:hypothetical protein